MPAPAPVPALPDTARITNYSGATPTTGPFAVNFALYGDGTDYGAWLDVTLNEVELVAGVDYTLSSPSGPIATLPRPITDATISLTVPGTGNLVIVGQRRPRRLVQFAENRGVAARDFNQFITDMVANLREYWDFFRTRALITPPGDQIGMLPNAVTRANALLGFDNIGNPIASSISGGGGGADIKLSQIAAAGSAPALTDQIVGVTGGTTDNLFTLTQIQSTIGGGGGGTPASPTGSVQYDNAGSFGAFGLWNGSSTFSLGNTSTAQGLRVYNTVDTLASPTNYERGVFDWTTNSNVLTIGSMAGGTGAVREIYIVGGTSLRFYGAGGSAYLGRFYAGGPNGILLDGANNTYINFGTSFDVGVGRSSAGVLAVGNGGTSSNNNGWMNWAGEARVTGDVNANNTTTLATATGLSVALQAGRTYSFDVHLSFTCTAAQGIRAAMVATGGLTATNIIYDGWIVDSGANGIKGNAQATALGTVVANAATTGTAGHVQIYGTITVNVAGTINVQFAQSVAAANNTTVKQGSYMIVRDMP